MHILERAYLLVVFLALVVLANTGSFSAAPRTVIAATLGPDFRISASPAGLTVNPGGSNSSTIVLQGAHGFTGVLMLTATTRTLDLLALVNPRLLTLSGGNTRAVSNLTVSANLLTPPGNYSITVSATNITLTRSVRVPVVITRPHQSFMVLASCLTATTGKPVTCNASTKGGAQPYNFSWTAPGGSPSTGTGSSFTTNYQTKGTDMVNVTATDSTGATASDSTSITVTPKSLIVNVSCGTATAGKPVACNASATGGTSPYTVSWSATNGTPSTGIGNTFTTTFAVNGTDIVSVTVTDANGVTGSEDASVSVTAQALGPDFTFSPALPASGETINFIATVAGGTSPYSFSWDLGDGAVGIDSLVQHIYTVSSTTSFNVTLTATDAIGSTGTVSHIVTVTAPTGSSSGNPPPVEPSPVSSSPPNPLLAFNWPFAAIVAGNLFMVALALTRVPALRRKRTRKEASL